MREYATHHGRNVKRLREILGIKQEALAIELGKEWSQKKISALESKAQIDEDLLERIAGVFKVPVETIKDYNDEMTIYNIQNNYEGANASSSTVSNGENTLATFHECTFNPFDKMLELMEENKKLYERLLQEKDMAIAKLEGLVKGKN
ncbi:helix-turn-helix domain-containing protein [Chitinophagaceae bacterium MMS25-I14]